MARSPRESSGVAITLGGTSASLVGVAAADGAGTAASLTLALAGAPSVSTIPANGAPSPAH